MKRTIYLILKINYYKKNNERKLIISIENYDENYVSEKLYLFDNDEIHVEIRVKEIEKIEFENRIDYINSQMDGEFLPIL